MGVYIKGMEMPAMCSECDFCGGLILPDNIYTCDCPSEKIHGKNITRAIEEDCRHPNCPLIEVPEPHGRLGDLDELKTAFPCGESIRTESVRATIDHMPTIIQASTE